MAEPKASMWGKKCIYEDIHESGKVVFEGNHQGITDTCPMRPQKPLMHAEKELTTELNLQHAQHEEQKCSKSRPQKDNQLHIWAHTRRTSTAASANRRAAPSVTPYSNRARAWSGSMASVLSRAASVSSMRPAARQPQAQQAVDGERDEWAGGAHGEPKVKRAQPGHRAADGAEVEGPVEPGERDVSIGRPLGQGWQGRGRGAQGCGMT